jgi:hypothetical protein
MAQQCVADCVHRASTWVGVEDEALRACEQGQRQHAADARPSTGVEDLSSRLNASAAPFPRSMRKEK